jgi:hypothetical protein
MWIIKNLFKILVYKTEELNKLDKSKNQAVFYWLNKIYEQKV